jgi:hypothetical protein
VSIFVVKEYLRVPVLPVIEGLLQRTPVETEFGSVRGNMSQYGIRADAANDLIPGESGQFLRRPVPEPNATIRVNKVDAFEEVLQHVGVKGLIHRF